MIYLYHGTDVEFLRPDPKKGRLGTDFGQGFYLTPHFESAANMARRVAFRHDSPNRLVLCYSLDENEVASAGLKVKTFNYLEPTWLRFVVANRFFQRDAVEHNLDARWDIVHGLIADDKLVQLLNALVRGEKSEAAVLEILRAAPYRSVQYTFHTDRAVSLLKLIEVRHV